MHEELVDTAKEAINAVFSDRSVSPTETLAALRELSGDLATMMDALEHDMGGVDERS